jgi:hypothetical protein
MSRSSEETVLLGALLDRLGNTQAQALLARLDRWLTRDEREPRQEFDRDQTRALDTPYDRRKRVGNTFRK